MVFLNPVPPKAEPDAPGEMARAIRLPVSEKQSPTACSIHLMLAL
jgi:hypothetical protein